jgi:hypothetical protein
VFGDREGTREATICCAMGRGATGIMDGPGDRGWVGREADEGCGGCVVIGVCGGFGDVGGERGRGCADVGEGILE